MRNGFIGLAGVLALSGSAVGFACSGGSDDKAADDDEVVAASSCTRSTGGTPMTDLCGASALNTLTQEETLKLCNDTGAHVVSTLNRATACKYMGIISAASNSSPTVTELQTACSNTESACSQDASITGPGDNTLCGQIPPTCEATVEQYSTCVLDEAVLFEQGASALIDCSMLTFENLSTAYDVPTAAMLAPSCMALETACPSFSLPYIN